MVTYFEAGNNQYQINYTVNSLCAYEDRFGTDITAILTNPTVVTLRGLLWAGLLDKNSDLTLEDVGGIMDGYLSGGKMLGDITVLCITALQDAGFFKRAGREKAPAKKKAK